MLRFMGSQRVGHYIVTELRSYKVVDDTLKLEENKCLSNCINTQIAIWRLKDICYLIEKVKSLRF